MSSAPPPRPRKKGRISALGLFAAPLLASLWGCLLMLTLVALVCDVFRIARLPERDAWLPAKSGFAAAANIILAWQSRRRMESGRIGDIVFFLLVWSGVLYYWLRVQAA